MPAATFQRRFNIIQGKDASLYLWDQAARLIITSIPNSLISHLGVSFNIKYYSAIADSKNTCVIFSVNEREILQGVIVGALERNNVYYKSLREHPFQMALAANIRLFSPFVLKWLFFGFLDNAGASLKNRYLRTSAELIVISVCPDARGSDVARELVGAMERSFKNMASIDGYNIFTEESNIPANRFYRKIGASFIETYTFHGRRVNKWFKNL